MNFWKYPRSPGFTWSGICSLEDRGRASRYPRAHTAVRQAKIVAFNILAEIRGRDKKPYRYVNTAEMVSLGASKAVFRFHVFEFTVWRRALCG